MLITDAFITKGGLYNRIHIIRACKIVFTAIVRCLIIKFHQKENTTETDDQVGLNRQADVSLRRMQLLVYQILFA
jgi:hypothetical protein